MNQPAYTVEDFACAGLREQKEAADAFQEICENMLGFDPFAEGSVFGNKISFIKQLREETKKAHAVELAKLLAKNAKEMRRLAEQQEAIHRAIRQNLSPELQGEVYRMAEEEKAKDRGWM